MMIKNCDGGEMIVDIYTLIESKLNLYTALFTTQVLKCFTATTKVPEGHRHNIKHGQISISDQIELDLGNYVGHKKVH